MGGPTGTSSDTNVDDYYSPEINSDSANFASEAPLQLVIPACIESGKPHLPDQDAVSAGDDYTGSFQNIQCYDGLKVKAILNEIDGKNHDGTDPKPVPAIFGMNFQAVSIGQKLIYSGWADGPAALHPERRVHRFGRDAKRFAAPGNPSSSIIRSGRWSLN